MDFVRQGLSHFERLCSTNLTTREMTNDFQLWQTHHVFFSDHTDNYRVFCRWFCKFEGRQFLRLADDICWDSTCLVHNLQTWVIAFFGRGISLINPDNLELVESELVT